MGWIASLICSIASVSLFSHHGGTEAIVGITSNFKSGSLAEISYTCFINMVGFALTYKGLRSLP